MGTFEDKNIVITGGAGGIGFLMGRETLAKGANKLIICDNNETNIDKARKKLDDFSDRIAFYKVDLADADQIYKMAERALDDHRHVDVLINSAGIVVGKKFESYSRYDIQKIIGINLLGAMHVTRAFLPGMIDRDSGHIVNIASAAGLIANPGMSVYASSKWGMIGWSESLRLEQQKQNRSIRVTTIEPSYIDTGLFEGVSPPLLTPLLDAEAISKNIIRAVEKNKIHLRSPFMVKFLPFLKGILPTPVFDIVAGKLFRVYHSMDTFKGRNQ